MARGSELNPTIPCNSIQAFLKWKHYRTLYCACQHTAPVPTLTTIVILCFSTMGSNYLNLYFLSMLVLFAPWAHAQQRTNKTVDDTDVFNSYNPGGIQYGPAWYVEPDGRSRFNRTLHTSTTAASNLIYFFQGDAIHYYADRDYPHGPARVYLDGDQTGEVVLSNASSLQYQKLLWSKYNLGPGDHQIIISHAGTDGQYIGLDYFVIESDHGFTPSQAGPAASSIPSEAVTIDDNDLTYVSYSAGWDPAVQTSQYHAFHFKNTMHRTSQPGASVSFKFNGTAVWYYTDLSPGHARVNVTLDGKQSWVVTGDATFISAQRILWNVTDLPYGEHTVVITHQDTTGLWATLDFFRYLPTEPTPSAPPKSSPPIGPIVGGIVGGIVLLVLCGIAYILRRRRTAKYRPYFEPKDSNGPPLLNPSPGSVSQPVPSQPVWGYVSQPYYPPTPDILNGPSPVTRLQKGQLIQMTDEPAGATAPSSTPASSSWAPTASVRGEVDMRSLDNPPPYV
ncbi:hypothetical protein ACGC1H_002378 [Rhizoctonia solani]|uniref:Transmembrane protein n=1 Tax=Rhizoctonia solani TaxID=456999 RepID=A0A8H3H1P3_9AGAM|nr:unnamed protein product [Rhizoctonia solani]